MTYLFGQVIIWYRGTCEAIDHNELIMFNKLIGSKNLISGYRMNGHAQYRGIVHGNMRRSNDVRCKAKILLMRSSRSSAVGSQSVRILISKGYRAHTMLETSNSLQREPQRADLNMRREVITRPPRPVFICHVDACGFISRQWASLILAGTCVKKMTCYVREIRLP